METFSSRHNLAEETQDSQPTIDLAACDINEGLDNPAFSITSFNVDEGTSLDSAQSHDSDYERPVRRASKATVRFSLTRIAITLSSILWVACIFCTVVVPVFMVGVGASFIDTCSRFRAIPILLLTTGGLMTLSNLINVANQSLAKCSCALFDDNKRKSFVASANVLLNVSVMISFVSSCVWIYSDSSRPSGNSSHLLESEADICSSIPYHFYFWLINLTLLFFTLLMLSALVACLWTFVKPKNF